jgi:Secretion system C-terminal sorting domain
MVKPINGQYITKFIKVSDSIILGTLASFSIARIDEEGKLIWTKLSTISLVPGSQSARCGAFTQTKDGNIVMIGSFSKNNIWTNEVVKLTPQGQLLWTKAFATDDPTVGDCFYSVFTRPNDTCVYASGDKIKGQITKGLLFGLGGCTTTPVKEIQDNFLTISVLPNPFIHEMRVKLDNSPLIVNGNFEFFDINGRVVRRGRFSQNEFVIERHNLNSGLYILKISTIEGRFYSNKVVVQ